MRHEQDDPNRSRSGVDVGTDIGPIGILRWNARFNAHTVAVVFEGREITFRELAEAVELQAGRLAAGGIGAGDRVAYLGVNDPLLLETYLAAARLNAIFVPVNSRLVADEVRHILADSAAHTVVVQPSYRPLVDAIAADLPATRFLLAAPEGVAHPLIALGPRWSWLAAVDPDTPTDQGERSADDVAALMYTAGTTGRPKGAVLTHGNLWWSTVNVDVALRPHPHAITLVAVPMFHIGGLNAFALGTLARGGTVVVHRTFDAGRVLKDLVQYRVTSMFGVPTMYEALAATPGFVEADLRSLCNAIVGGAPVPPRLIENYAHHGIALQQVWGLTETAPYASHLAARWTTQRPESAGAPMPHTQLRVVDVEKGKDVAGPDEPGELWVRGPHVAKGYWAGPHAVVPAVDEEGWLHTGDIGSVDADGFVRILDRLKDMIITGGENVYSAEVERVLAGCPGLREAAVIGAPHPLWGETVVAVVVPEPGTEPDLAEVRAYAGTWLARYKLPTELRVLTKLPYNAAGKVDKIALRAEAPSSSQEDTGQENASRDHDRWADLRALAPRARHTAVVALVRAEVQTALGMPDAADDLDRGFLDLGFDSRLAMQFRHRLSGLIGVDLPATVVFDLPSPRALVRHLEKLLDPSAPALLSDERPDNDLLAELDGLHSRIGAVTDTRLRTNVATRLRKLLLSTTAEHDHFASELSDQDGSDLSSASAEDLFALIDGELGS